MWEAVRLISSIALCIAMMYGALWLLDWGMR
jgi:hypothetical protein